MTRCRCSGRSSTCSGWIMSDMPRHGTRLWCMGIWRSRSSWRTMSRTGGLWLRRKGATLNGGEASITCVPGSSTPTPNNPSGVNIVIGGDVDKDGEALQITIPQGASTFPLSLIATFKALLSISETCAVMPESLQQRQFSESGNGCTRESQRRCSTESSEHGE